MRIALSVIDFPRFSETFIVNKFLGLLDSGLDVHIVCSWSSPGEFAKFPQLARPEILRKRIHTAWPRSARLAALLFPIVIAACLLRSPAATVRYLVRGWKRFGLGVLRRFYLDSNFISLAPDLIHFEFGALAAGNMYIRDLLGCLVTVSFRGYDLNFVGLEAPGFYQDVWENADGIHVLGEDLWRRAVRRGCPPDRLHVKIPPAIDAGFFDPRDRVHQETAGTADRPYRILSVGRLEWKKGYEYALEAVRMLVDRGVRCSYTIVGEGYYREGISFVRHQLGLDDIVEMRGAEPASVVKEEMLKADVLLHASVSEGFCNAVIEAQAMKLPVVCTDADGLAENVEDGRTGFVVARRNPSAMAFALQTLAENPQLRQQMGDAGRERVARHFRLSDQISAFHAFYECLGREHAPADAAAAAAWTAEPNSGLPGSAHVMDRK